MSLPPNLPSLPIPLIALLLTSLLPTAIAASATVAVDTVGFWLGLSLIFLISAAETALSVIWTRYRVIPDSIHPCELSCRVCAREISISTINPHTALEIANNGLLAGFNSGSESSATYSRSSIIMSRHSSSSGCSCCGWETRHAEVHRLRRKR